MTITGVCGWAIPPSWFEALIENHFPEVKVRAIYPENPFDPKVAKRLLGDHPADLFLGYSLGSLWLLHHKRFLSFYSMKVLLAPILAFPKESGMGGKISRGQLKYMIKLLSRNSEDISILKMFYKVSGLELPETFFDDFSDESVLIRGLEFLDVIEETEGRALDFITLVGENDSLLDSAEIKRQIPHAQIVHQVGHAPDPLIAALSQILK